MDKQWYDKLSSSPGFAPLSFYEVASMAWHEAAQRALASDVPTNYVVGRKYHCAWAKSRGMVWVLKAVSDDGRQALLETPRTKKQIFTDIKSLREINSNIRSAGAPHDVDDDHFTWWFDELQVSPGYELLSISDVAALAWREATARVAAPKEVAV